MKNIVAIDLGSNSIRFLKMDCKTEQPISSFHKTVKTADGLAKTGKISYPALDRIIVAINEAKEKMDFSDSIVKAVATEAIRQAINGQEILDGIRNNTGVEFEIIDGDDEAKYALIATKKRLELLGKSPKSFVIADIGGASTELIFYYGDRVISKSFRVGIVTVTQSFRTLSEIANAIPALMNEMKEFCYEVYSKYGRVEEFVAMAGTPTTVASLKLGMSYATYDAEKINGIVLERVDLYTQLKSLLEMSVQKRQEMVGVERDDLIISGILIYEEIYNITRFGSSTVIDDGVREGVAFDACCKDSKKV